VGVSNQINPSRLKFNQPKKENAKIKPNEPIEANSVYKVIFHLSNDK
jgi:hypothetical protein